MNPTQKLELAAKCCASEIAGLIGSPNLNDYDAEAFARRMSELRETIKYLQQLKTEAEQTEPAQDIPADQRCSKCKRPIRGQYISSFREGVAKHVCWECLKHERKGAQ